MYIRHSHFLLSRYSKAVRSRCKKVATVQLHCQLKSMQSFRGKKSQLPLLFCCAISTPLLCSSCNCQLQCRYTLHACSRDSVLHLIISAPPLLGLTLYLSTGCRCTLALYVPCCWLLYYGTQNTKYEKVLVFIYNFVCFCFYVFEWLHSAHTGECQKSRKLSKIPANISPHCPNNLLALKMLFNAAVGPELNFHRGTSF